MRGLADVLEKNELTGVRIAVNQDLVIPWVPFDRVRAIYDQLGTLDLATPGARTISDVTGCPGATTCNLGITRSLTLADVLSRELDGYSDPEIQKLRIKISGCPNSCGHHHIADIGFYGNVRKVGEQQAPYYQLRDQTLVNVTQLHSPRIGWKQRSKNPKPPHKDQRLPKSLRPQSHRQYRFLRQLQESW